jgi:hypothetical protein
MNTIRNNLLYGRMSPRLMAHTLGCSTGTIKSYYAEDGIAMPRELGCYWVRADVTIECDGRGLRVHRGDTGVTERPIRSHGILDADHWRLSCYYTDAKVWVTCLWNEHGALVGTGSTREESIVCAEEGRGLEVAP